MTPTKLKGDWTSWRDKPHATNPNAEQKRREAEAFAALADYIRRAGGFVVSPPGRLVRIETPKGSSLAGDLEKLGYAVMPRGSTTRVTGTTSIVSPKMERQSRVTPSAFLECDVLEVTLSGK